MIELLTGTGERLAGNPARLGRSGPSALVLAPTRELALQIAEAFATLGAARGIETVVVIGGESMAPQLAGLRKRPAVVVATPGRLIDHLERGTLSLGGIRLVALAAGGRLRDLGVAAPVARSLRATPH